VRYTTCICATIDAHVERLRRSWQNLALYLLLWLILSILFPSIQRKFCVIVQALGESMSVSLECLGIAYDKILKPGIRSHHPRVMSGNSKAQYTNFRKRTISPFDKTSL
jgi:hypothetical protein